MSEKLCYWNCGSACWQQVEVKRCDIVTCPLWPYRPFSKRNGQIEAEVIAIVTEIDRNKREYGD